MLRALLLFAVGLVILFAGFIVAVNVISDDDPVDCATERLQPGEWAAERGDHVSQQTVVRACRQLEGRTQAQVRELLGEPDRQQGDLWQYGTFEDDFDLGNLDVRFGPDGRVADLETISTGD